MAEKLNKAGKTTGVQASVLQSLVSAANGIQAGVSERQGDMGAHIKKAEDVHGVHRKAFKDICKLARMDPGKRAEYLRSLDDYREKLNLNPDPDLFEEKDEDSGEGDEQKRRGRQAKEAEAQDQAAENAVRLKGGIKPTEPALTH